MKKKLSKAFNKAYLYCKIKSGKILVSGSTMLETLIAFLILLIIFFITMRTFTNLDRVSNPTLKTFAFIEAENAMRQSFILKEKTDHDAITINGALIIKTETSVVDYRAGLMLAHVIVYTKNDRVLAERKEYFIIDQK